MRSLSVKADRTFSFGGESNVRAFATIKREKVKRSRKKEAKGKIGK